MLHVFHVKLLQGGFQKAHQRSKHAVQKILKKRNLLKFPDLCEIPGNYTLEKKKLCFEVSVCPSVTHIHMYKGGLLSSETQERCTR